MRCDSSDPSKWWDCTKKRKQKKKKKQFKVIVWQFSFGARNTRRRLNEPKVQFSEFIIAHYSCENSFNGFQETKRQIQYVSRKNISLYFMSVVVIVGSHSPLPSLSLSLTGWLAGSELSISSMMMMIDINARAIFASVSDYTCALSVFFSSLFSSL